MDAEIIALISSSSAVTASVVSPVVDKEFSAVTKARAAKIVELLVDESDIRPVTSALASKSATLGVVLEEINSETNKRATLRLVTSEDVELDVKAVTKILLMETAQDGVTELDAILVTRL